MTLESERKEIVASDPEFYWDLGDKSEPHAIR